MPLNLALPTISFQKGLKANLLHLLSSLIDHSVLSILPISLYNLLSSPIPFALLVLPIFLSLKL